MGSANGPTEWADDRAPAAGGEGPAGSDRAVPEGSRRDRLDSERSRERRTTVA